MSANTVNNIIPKKTSSEKEKYKIIKVNVEKVSSKMADVADANGEDLKTMDLDGKPILLWFRKATKDWFDCLADIIRVAQENGNDNVNIIVQDDGKFTFYSPKNA